MGYIITIVFAHELGTLPGIMAPSAIAPSTIQTEVPINLKAKKQQQPLQLSGALDKYESFDTTPVIGREFPTANLVEWLESPDSDALIRDLAITSEYPPKPGEDGDDKALTTPRQFRSEASSSSGHRTTSRTSCRRSSSYGSGRSPGDRRRRASTSTRF